MKAFVLQGGFMEPTAGEQPDRTVAIGPADSAWIPVFDEATEDQDTHKPRSLAAALGWNAEFAALGCNYLDKRAAGIGNAAWPNGDSRLSGAIKLLITNHFIRCCALGIMQSLSKATRTPRNLRDPVRRRYP